LLGLGIVGIVSETTEGAEPMKLETVALTTAVMVIAFTLPVVAGEEIHEFLPADGAAGDLFGKRVSLHGGLALVGAPGDDDNGVDSGSAYLFEAVTGQEMLKLVPADGAAGDWFGDGVSLDDGLALVGASRDDAHGLDSGSAYIFDAVTGQELLKLTPSFAAAGDEFGYSVSLDNGRALVGAPFDVPGGGPPVGSAYIFDATTGQQLHRVQGSSTQPGSQFGSSVSLDGGLALVGAPFNSAWVTDGGTAHLFDVATGQELLLLKPSGWKTAWFGYSVSLDGDQALIGAPMDFTEVTFTGSAFLFDATTGQELRKFRASDEMYSDFLGWSVSLDGDLALVSAIGDDDNGSHSGSAYLFDAPGGSELRKLVPSDGAANDSFGIGASLEGNLALLGADWADDHGTDSGSAYLFHAGPGVPFGGGGPGFPCPCGNSNDGSLDPLLAGCDNGQYSSGATMGASGVPSISDDTLVFTGSHLTHNSWGLFFQGDLEALPGLAMGTHPNGLLQVHGSIRRFGVLQADASGYVDSTDYQTVYGRTISSWGGVVAGDSRSYQFWFRTPGAAAPCTAGESGGSNTTNGYTIHWLP